jgi:hypothetical protein
MRISEFKTALGEGGARPNQFRVELQFPGDSATANEQLLVTGASLPASTVNPAIIQYRGREIKLAGERIFDPWTITIVNDTKFTLRNKFETWMNEMNDRFDNTAAMLSPEHYQREIRVIHLDRNDQELMGIQLEEAFPINMSEIALQYAQNDIIEEYTVTFQYQSYNVLSG